MCSVVILVEKCKEWGQFREVRILDFVMWWPCIQFRVVGVGCFHVRRVRYKYNIVGNASR
eukprot:scaffold39980_cov50-Attheya_sp.AAC.2